ncbi:MAG TPA: hypothetical protein DCQ36_08830 [Actinobacteria bacterium]|nr:hypothetical protein [Actinomycetota bacterium]
MKERVRAAMSLGHDLANDYRRIRGSLAAGGLAYFVALSLAPAALAFGTLAGLLLKPAQIRSALDRLAQRAPETFDEVQPFTSALVSAIESASGSTFTITTLVSLMIAIYASSKIVLGLRMAMNSAFGVVETRSGLVDRAVAAVVTLVAMIVGVAVVVLLTIVPQVLAWLDLPSLPVTTGAPWLDWLVVSLIVFTAVRWILTHGSDRRQRVSWLSPGAWAATAGIVGSTVGVGIYAHFSTTIGTAVLLFGTAVVLLLWLYLCFVSLLWGAVIEAHSSKGDPAGSAPVPCVSGGEPARGTSDDAGQEGGDSRGEAHVQSVRPGREDSEGQGPESRDPRRDDAEGHSSAG